LKVTYIANEGFLISKGSKKVLIDALFYKINERYAAPPENVLKQMETAQPPFDDVDVILHTHNHHDHFNANTVSKALRSNQNAILIATPQAKEDIVGIDEQFDEIASRVFTEDLAPQDTLSKNINGIDIRIIRTKHSGKNETTQNQMYLVDMDGTKIFHEGDSRGSLKTFENLGLEKESIDVAFVHFWFPINEDARKIINDYLKPRQIVLMHMPVDRFEHFKKKIDKFKDELPPMIIFKNSMEMITF
jgi:L-ascorbate metabolism protein UlaG (beta-lactamase superfamily)